MRRALAAAVIATISLTGCGSGDAGGTQPDDTVEITIDGNTITPNGERIDIGTGETLTLHVDSDRAGELHVHSTPEQELPFDKGVTTLELTVDTPGVVDVEEHDADVVVLQLEVS